MEILGSIIIGIIAFAGAYIGTKTIKKQLIDKYIEERVKKAQESNDKTLSFSRDLKSSFEESYSKNKRISIDELQTIIKQCKDLSKISEDGGNEVATTSYLLYQTVKALKPSYKNDGATAFEVFTIKDLTNLVNNTLDLIIYYSTNIAPIPYRVKLKRKSLVKRKFRKMLSYKNFYSLQHQPFGLTLNPNSEVVLNYCEVLFSPNNYIFPRNFFQFLQTNVPIIYHLIASKIFMPVVLEKRLKDESFPFSKMALHLIKVRPIRSYGIENGDFVEFYYSNLSLFFGFVESIKEDEFSEEFNYDGYLKKDFNLDSNYDCKKILNETFIVKVKLDLANTNYKLYGSNLKKQLKKQKKLFYKSDT